MTELKKAITRLKTEVEKSYSYSSPSKEMVCFLIQESRNMLDRIDGADHEDEKSYQLELLLIVGSNFVNSCLDAIKSEKPDAFFKGLLYLRESISFTYSYLSESSFRTELELTQLSNDIHDLREQKEQLEENISDLKEILSLKDGLQQSNVDAEVLILDIKEKSEEFEEFYSDMNESKRNVDEIRNSIKRISDDIDSLHIQSIQNAKFIKEIIASGRESQAKNDDITKSLINSQESAIKRVSEINEVLGDANRTSMASSFKAKEGELAKSVRLYDFINYASLGLIAFTAFLIVVNPSFFNISGLNLQTFYERLLIFIPLGFISWFASRKSQQLFLLKEEYAYKYASAVAFEGYKRQTENNEIMHDELLKIAIENLAKNPTVIFDKKLSHTPIEKITEQLTEGAAGLLKKD